MRILVAQHPWLWLLCALLAGFLLHWLLDLFVLRRHWLDMENRLRRRSEDFDSERYAHSRTQAELKARTAEVEASRKAAAQGYETAVAAVASFTAATQRAS